MTTAAQISEALRFRKQEAARDKRDTQRHEAAEKRQKAAEQTAQQREDRKDFLAALRETGGAAHVLTELKTGFVYMGVLTIPLKDSAYNWIKKGTGRNPLVGLFKDLKAQGFGVSYRTGYENVQVGGCHDEGEFFPNYEYKRVESPYIRIQFPKEGDKA